MQKYYILSVDSFQDAFTRMDAIETFSFTFLVQNKGHIMDAVMPEDKLLIYRRAPVSGINVCMQVISKKDDAVELKKVIEVAETVRSDVMDVNLEEEYLEEISADKFNAICRKMVQGIYDGESKNDKDLSDNLKEQFKDYILNVLKLKSDRQAYELEKWSGIMVEKGLLNKDIYLITDVEEYIKVRQIIKDSDVYREYKAKCKATNPNSGLASDQGMTNYEKFLIYLSQAEKKEKRITGADNILLYGVPGVGKSHEIQEKYCDDVTRMERVVFHPDYTYSDFVGQILPRVEQGQLKYVFTAGPFTKMLKKAWDNPGKEYYLIIEEINRGNAPAIFGEIFQLLDRKTEDSHKYDPSEYGESEYAIFNYDVSTEVFGKEEHEIRIPSNMWILATMNTSDQNVFTLDTAFQRRWSMHHMKNSVMSAEHAEANIEGSQIKWGFFASVINDMVVQINQDRVSSEDKRLGAYFVKRSELTVDKFPEKVLKYLWDDAFKMEKEAVFDERFQSLEEVIEAYEQATADKLQSTLKAEVYRKMMNQIQSEEGQSI